MNENTGSTRSPPVTNEFTTVVLAIKVVIIAVILIPVVRYALAPDEYDVQNTTVKVGFDKIENVAEETPVEVVLKKVVKRSVVVQPTCPRSYLLVILEGICDDLVLKNEFCVPGDIHDEKKHRVPGNSRSKRSKEAKVPAIVNYAVGGLLMASLGAALVELYKAKKQPSKKDGKNPLSRKCSLADLTVLKHHRKELVRRESILEEESRPSRLPGMRPPPLRRRCSFPVGPSIVPLLEGRPAMVIDSGRRESLVVDGRTQSVIVVDNAARRSSLIASEGRRMSVCGEESPERRHHSRLVHRH